MYGVWFKTMHHFLYSLDDQKMMGGVIADFTKLSRREFSSQAQANQPTSLLQPIFHFIMVGHPPLMRRREDH